MKAIHLIPVVLLLATPFAAQGAEKKPQEATGKPKEAAAVEPGALLEFPVSGLTADNVAKVKESLTGLSTQTYICEKCKFQQGTAGKCEPCDTALVPHKQVSFQSVTPSAEKSSVALVLDPNGTIRYSELQSALSKNAVQIDPAKFPIAGRARLVLRGGKVEDAAAIEKALKDAKVFDEAKASFDATTSETHVAVRAATPPTHAKVKSALETAGVKATFSDVIWGRMQPNRKG